MISLPLAKGGLQIGSRGGRMVYPRWLARFWAWHRSYFWTPCPVCGDHFAGFEWGPSSLMLDDGMGTAVCSKPECVAAARKQTREWYAARGDAVIQGDGCLIVIRTKPHNAQ